MMDFDQSHLAVIVSVMLLAISSMLSGWRISRLEKQNQDLCKALIGHSEILLSLIEKDVKK